MDRDQISLNVKRQSRPNGQQRDVRLSGGSLPPTSTWSCLQFLWPWRPSCNSPLNQLPSTLAFSEPHSHGSYSSIDLRLCCGSNGIARTGIPIPKRCLGKRTRLTSSFSYDPRTKNYPTEDIWLLLPIPCPDLAETKSIILKDHILVCI